LVQIDYINANSSLLFETIDIQNKIAIFDKKGFRFSNESKLIYNQLKHTPHIYVAYNEIIDGYSYIGKSFQSGGRWKKQHAYHLGTLAYQILNTMKYDDQNHQHWIDSWMKIETFEILSENNYSIQLEKPVKICFIPFEIYTGLDYLNLDKEEIKLKNVQAEAILIKEFKRNNFKLLNVQMNK